MVSPHLFSYDPPSCPFHRLYPSVFPRYGPSSNPGKRVQSSARRLFFRGSDFALVPLPAKSQSVKNPLPFPFQGGTPTLDTARSGVLYQPLPLAAPPPNWPKLCWFPLASSFSSAKSIPLVRPTSSNVFEPSSLRGCDFHEYQDFYERSGLPFYFPPSPLHRFLEW